MIVLGVDPSMTSTGIALLDTEEREWITTRVRSAAVYSTEAQARRIRAMAHRVADFVDMVDPPFGAVDLVVIEGPSFGSRQGAVLLGGLWWRVVDEVCVRFAAPVLVIPPNTRALYATGDGHAKKPAVLANVRLAYPEADVSNHDVADAVALAALGARVHGRAVEQLECPWMDQVAARVIAREKKAAAAAAEKGK